MGKQKHILCENLSKSMKWGLEAICWLIQKSTEWIFLKLKNRSSDTQIEGNLEVNPRATFGYSESYKSIL